MYSNRISALAYNYITHITKEDFLLAFKAAYNKAFIENNICVGFRGARLVLLDLDVVILKLNVQLCTLTPPARQHTAWELKTPRNTHKIEAQSMLVYNRIRNHYRLLASSINKKVAQLTKGAQQMAHEMVLMREEIACL